jgi:hypothetical protein
MQQDKNVLNDWKLLIEEQSKGDLSKRAFCRKKGIKPSHFYYYQNKFNPDNKLPSSETKSKELNPFFIPVDLKKPESINLSEKSSIRCILKNGIECILPNDMDMRRIKEIIGVLLTC